MFFTSSNPNSSEPILAAQAIGHAALIESTERAQASLAQQFKVSLALVIADICAFCVAIGTGGLAAYLVSFLFSSNFSALDAPDLAYQLLLWATIVIAVCLWYAQTGHYTLRRSFEDDLKSMLGPLLFGLLVNGFLQFAMKTSFSRLWLLCGWASAAITIPLTRIAARQLLDWAGLWRRRALILGRGDHLNSIRDSLSADYYLGYDPSINGSIPTDRQSSSKLLNKLGAEFIGFIVLVPSDEETQRLEHIVDALNTRMISYAVVPPFCKLPLANLSTLTFLNSDAVLLTVRNGLASPVSQACKRTFDIAVALFLLLTLSPLFLVVSLILACNGGPILFAHERIGRGGRPFKCLKFRSMVPNAAEVLQVLLTENSDARDEWTRSHKLQHDPRKTWIGRVLRKSSLDELPQLINVLRGDMSLVGPRPVIQDELCRYYRTDNSYYLLVRPGITGVWQVNRSSEGNYEERVYLDSWYVRNWSMWNDVMLLCRTIPAVILCRGAY